METGAEIAVAAGIDTATTGAGTTVVTAGSPVPLTGTISRREIPRKQCVSPAEKRDIIPVSVQIKRTNQRMTSDPVLLLQRSSFTRCFKYKYSFTKILNVSLSDSILFQI